MSARYLAATSADKRVSEHQSFLDQATPLGRLCLGVVPEDFDLRRDFALGPSCFIGREHAWNGLDEFAFRDEYSDEDALWDDWKKTRMLANWYARELGQKLNARHRTSYGDAFWRELLLLWLLLLIQAAWVRDLSLARLASELGKKPLRIVIPKRERWAFADDLDFLDRGIRNPAFDAWLCGQLLRRRLPDAWQLVETPLGEPDVNAPPPKPRYPRLRSRLDSVPGMGRLSHAGSLLLHLRPPRGAQRLRSAECVVARPDGIFPPDFTDALDDLIAATMPRTLTDGFAAFDAGARRFRYRAGKKVVTAATKYRSENRFVLAHAKQAGEHVFRVQHGSGYGMARTMNAQEIEYFDSGFVSWGWIRDGLIPNAAIPLPSPMLSRLPPWASKTDDVILIGTNVELSPHPFKASPHPAQWLTYRKWKAMFAGALPQQMRERLVYRPRFGAQNDLDDVTYLEHRIGALRILEGDLTKAAARCRIAVIDHPGTAMHVLMAMGVPTVMFWQSEAWVQHPEAEAAFEGLRATKILFHDPVAAANHVAAVHNDPTVWWEQTDVREARSRWNRQFALTDRTWRRKWLAWLLKD